jgi:hypothetical protein
LHIQPGSIVDPISIAYRNAQVLQPGFYRPAAKDVESG